MNAPFGVANAQKNFTKRPFRKSFWAFACTDWASTRAKSPSHSTKKASVTLVADAKNTIVKHFSPKLYFLAAKSSSSILVALSDMTVPGPKIAAAPAW